jgi:hypothetical protein
MSNAICVLSQRASRYSNRVVEVERLQPHDSKASTISLLPVYPMQQFLTPWRACGRLISISWYASMERVLSFLIENGSAVARAKHTSVRRVIL